MSSVSILLVEDEPTWQAGFRALLEAEPRFSLVGVADCYDDAVALFDAHSPDVVLLDWQIAGPQDGIAVGNALLAKGLPSHRIVLVSGADPGSIPRHPFLAVPKTRVAEDLVDTIRQVVAA